MRRFLCWLVAKLDSWETLYIIISVVLILFLIAMIDILTRTRPLHMVWR